MITKLETADQWHLTFMGIANLFARNSKDTSRKVGAVITRFDNSIVSVAYNHFPTNCNDQVAERYERPAKYKWTEHAERNAIFIAAKYGVSLMCTRMYVPWFPCVECARAIIEAGIMELYCYEPDFGDPRWGEDFVIAKEMLEEAGVHLYFLPDPALAVETSRT